jgi:two-component sensor histidine kinase
MKTGTLGMELVRMLVDQLEGSLEVINSGGAEFRIDFDVQRFPVMPSN